ncbi:TIGR03915 family putative DNA repair protein [Suttonella ornithocola]|uniref:Probable DNA metabolism protein n=1 Tax=Suttonella ornithocola TaxID=279832 RepID=A0A380MNP9_9GAMM|nr:TIGR03915 family putative DNA repair protein [Suttonella ornithocola]SUO94249.1 probable DNA metabolism protein [Suttonella ornithocola]
MKSPSVILRYRDGLDGFLTAVFIAYEEKLLYARMADETAPNDLFSRNIRVMTDEQKAKRVWKKLSQLWKTEGVKLVLKALLVSAPERDAVLFSLIKYTLANPKQWVLNHYAQDEVLIIHQWARRVQREVHRMKAFVRFSQLENGCFYASIAPDFPILPLIAPFFATRFADQIWLIVDI